MVCAPQLRHSFSQSDADLSQSAKLVSGGNNNLQTMQLELLAHTLEEPQSGQRPLATEVPILPPLAVLTVPWQRSSVSSYGRVSSRPKTVQKLREATVTPVVLR